MINEHKKGFKAKAYPKKPKVVVEPPKPRNPVAKNASAAIGGGAAGAHKDKKKDAKQGKAKHKKAELAEQDSAEYNDEAGMAYNSLHTIHRATKGLAKTIKSGDNLPEWCQKKLSLAEDYLVTVWDYLQSEKNMAEAGSPTQQAAIAINMKKTGKKPKTNENYENKLASLLEGAITELDDTTKSSYKEKATKQVKDLEPHAKKGEYKDIAKRMIDRRQKGLARTK